MQRVLLLDFDGVVCNHTRASYEIAKRSQDFVKKVVNVKTDRDARLLNTHLYKTYGHTAVGLQKMGYKVSPKDFNDFVYSSLNYEDLFKDLKANHRKDIADLQYTSQLCKEKGVPIFIFSNAPRDWCYNIIDSMLDDSMWINMIDNQNDLKPSFVLYENISYKFKECKIVFVDDQIINFSWTLNNPQWTNVHFTHETYDTGEKNKQLICIQSLRDLDSVL